MKLNPYLDFDGNCEEAFTFYKEVFKVEFQGNGINRFADVPPREGVPPIAEENKNRVMHVALEIGEQTLMGCDIMPEMCSDTPFKKGTNQYISIHPDSRDEADRLFRELSNGGKVLVPLADQFWGDYFGSFADKFGVCWMVNYAEQSTF